MEDFIKHIKSQRENELSVGTNGPAAKEIPFFLQLMNFQKEFDQRRKWIEEFALDGDYDIVRGHLAALGNDLAKIYEHVNKIAVNEENCNCIQNITKEEFEDFLDDIGGLENGWGDRYWGKSKIRKFLFNITDWIISRLPYYEKSAEFCKDSKFKLFLNNTSYKMLRWILKDKRPKNPFRSMIKDAGYFSVGPGWYGLLKTLIQKATDAGWNKEVTQVKEKFGGLRFYVNGATSEAHDIIHKYENLSYEICEDCGDKGKQRPGGWIRTLCDIHFNEIKKK